MRSLSARVARTIARSRLLAEGDRVAAAVSGGSDSVALVFLLRKVAPEFGARLAGLMHVNHLLRGAEADADEEFCRRLAGRLGLPIEILRTDVAAIARERHMSLESAARRVRYQFFEEAAARIGATVVATGHTLDDQAETVLLRLLRGAGTRGLSGIRIRRSIFVRPLLDVTRDELRTYLAASAEPWQEDASNADVGILRNRIRHELVPVVRRIATRGTRALARLAQLAADDEMYLEALANEKLAGLVLERRSASAALDAARLATEPPALGRRMVRKAAGMVAPEVNLTARHLDAVWRLCSTDKPLGRLDLPGLLVERVRDRLTFREAAERPRARARAWPVRVLTVPGSVTVPEAGVMIAASLCTAAPILEAAAGLSVVIPAGSLARPLLVRNRRSGDRFQPLGAPGRRKLQDVLVDRKVPRTERDTVPVVTDANGEILWVAGVALAERCRVRLPDNGVLLLELRKP